MIIDTHLHPTNLVDEAWRHTGEPFTGERMLKLMDGPYMINGKPRRIDMGFIQPPPGNTGYRDGNRRGREGIRDYMSYVAELCQKYPDRFIGNFNFNPRWGPENGAAELEFHVKEYGFKMLKLHSNMHGYRPDRCLEWLRPAMKKCAELGVVVLIHTGDGPYSIPTQFYPIIREFPMVNFIIGHFGIQTGGNYSFELSGWGWIRPMSIANPAGASSRGSWNSPSSFRPTRSSSGRIHPPTTPVCGCVSLRFFARPNRRG
ncbi:amidohydrolase family protein [Paracoccus methylarcula]|uniref:amidohydrolase family protein n=1 Tax=Paracoccus methylarcula TaxID=72022 RepID=UPI0026CB2199